MPLFRPPNIEKLREERGVDGLIKALRRRHANVRSQAANALGELADLFEFPEVNWTDELLTGLTWPDQASPAPLVESMRRRPRGLEMLDTKEQLLGWFLGLLAFEKSHARWAGVETWRYKLFGDFGDKTALIAYDLGFTSNASCVDGTLYFCVTSARLVVTRVSLSASKFWSFPLQQVRQVLVSGAVKGQATGLGCGFADPTGLRRGGGLLGLPVVSFEFAGGGCLSVIPKLQSWPHRTDTTRDDDAAYLDAPQCEWLRSWLDQCNRYLALVRVGHIAPTESYARHVRAVERGGLRVVEALTACLDDGDAEVETVAAAALERIGGRQAHQAVAEYRGRQVHED